MRVHLRFLGILAEYGGCRNLELELNEGSTIKDLLEEVGKRYSLRFPKEVWDEKKGGFRPIVGIFIDGKDVDSIDMLLKEGSEVIFLPMISGGLSQYSAEK